MLMNLIKTRHSIRKYTDSQIKRKDLEQILEAGNYAPNAGGGQRSMMEIWSYRQRSLELLPALSQEDMRHSIPRKDRS